MFDPEIVEKWRKETVKEIVPTPEQQLEGYNKESDHEEQSDEREQSVDEEKRKQEQSTDDEPVFVDLVIRWTDAMFDYCIAELQHIAKNVCPTRKDGAVIVYNGFVVKSDSAVPQTVKLALQAAVKPLEDVPEKDKDWHPGSNELVLDLVHPSLFPLVYGKTRVIKEGEALVGLDDCVNRCGEGEVVVSVAPPPAKYQPYSSKFQWLPCEVDISGKDGSRYASWILTSHLTLAD